MRTHNITKLKSKIKERWQEAEFLEMEKGDKGRRKTDKKMMKICCVYRCVHSPKQIHYKHILIKLFKEEENPYLLKRHSLHSSPAAYGPFF